MGRRHGGARKDRGAALPEYALILGAIALGIVVSVDAATDATGDEIESSFEVPDGTDAWEGGGPTTTGGVTTTTVAPTFPTTSSTTTTTTGGPTTTTTTTLATTSTTSGATTSTTAAVTTTTTLQTNITSIFPVTQCSTSPCKGTWQAQFKIALLTTTGTPVADAVVTATVSKPNGSGTSSKSCTSSVSGVCIITLTSINNSKASVSLTVIGVTASPVWSGGNVLTSTATRPA